MQFSIGSKVQFAGSIVTITAAHEIDYVDSRYNEVKRAYEPVHTSYWCYELDSDGKSLVANENELKTTIRSKPMFIIKLDLPTGPSYVAKPPSRATWLTSYYNQAKRFKTADLAAKWVSVHGIQSAIIVEVS